VNWDATYRVTTPLFLGGANPNKHAELRPSSIKGLLRFWFRAIALAQLRKWSTVKSLENIVFGSTKGQSSTLLTIRDQEGLSEKKESSWLNFNGIRYLGYGVIDQRGNAMRPHLEPGGRFTLQIRTKKGIPEEAAHFLPLALQALGLFGAAGARSRKGFGSLSLESIACNGNKFWKMPETVEDLGTCLQTLLREIKVDNSNDALPEYSAFSRYSRVWIALTGSDALEVLNRIGYEMLCYRSYGRENNKGKHVLPDDTEAEQNFADDHDLMLGFCRGNSIDTHPRRVVFGLPHNYFFISTRDKAGISPASKEYNRRASPLFIHIHALGKNHFAAVLTLLPAVFLPRDVKIEISSGRHNRTTVDCNVDYNNVTNFINRPAFRRSKVVVWP
jgi:CRISPR-associated protein Cmr1